MGVLNRGALGWSASLPCAGCAALRAWGERILSPQPWENPLGRAALPGQEDTHRAGVLVMENPALCPWVSPPHRTAWRPSWCPKSGGVGIPAPGEWVPSKDGGPCGPPCSPTPQMGLPTVPPCIRAAPPRGFGCLMSDGGGSKGTQGCWWGRGTPQWPEERSVSPCADGGMQVLWDWGCSVPGVRKSCLNRKGRNTRP